jgi:hypothetical protein
VAEGNRADGTDPWPMKAQHPREDVAMRLNYTVHDANAATLQERHRNQAKAN